MVFIVHDLGVVRMVSDNVMVTYLGKVCEFGDPFEVEDIPAHLYTRALLDSVPLTHRDAGFAGPALEGVVPSPLVPQRMRVPKPPPSCTERCETNEPQMRQISPHFAACHFPRRRNTVPNEYRPECQAPSSLNTPLPKELSDIVTEPRSSRCHVSYSGWVGAMVAEYRNLRCPG